MTSNEPIAICFVCLGNICRSPLAEGVFQDLVIQAGLEERILIHSAGTGGWHVDSPPDTRMKATAQARDIHLQSRAQQFQPGDFKRFDLVLAMDRSNKSSLESMGSPAQAEQKLRLFRSFDPKNGGDLDVPDPYYGGGSGFDHVFEIVHRTCPNILNFVRQEFLHQHEG